MSGDPDLRPLLEQAFREIRGLRREVEESDRRRAEPIAVVGLGCRFPGNVSNPADYWRLLRDGVDAVGEIPPDRWDTAAWYDPDPEAPGKMYCARGAFLEGVDQFDPGFFGIAPREAAGIDPQQRLLLEVAWEALEHAGIAPDRLAGTNAGVFAGLFLDDYSRLGFFSGDPARLEAYGCLGALRGMAAGRLAYVLGVHGPALQVDTACSSSLLAVHLACQSLRSRECDLALAGGVNLILSPETSVGLCKLRAMSRTGRCRAFDAKADGFVRGEGCGIAVLKRVSDALADGDEIFALVRGSAVGHDGRSNGLTAPSGPAQVAVIRRALEGAGLAPRDIQYVEAHGTGTLLGDPIEAEALIAALGRERSAGEPLRVGSVKTNLGHLESAAGIASFLKVVLALRHGEIPPSLHFEEPNPYIPWDGSALEVATRRTPWPRERGLRRAGVSAFGMSGTNVHVVLEEAPERPAAAVQADRPVHLLVLSARDETALRDLARATADRLRDEPGLAAGDVCHTAGVGRARFPVRLAVPGGSTGELEAELRGWLAGPPAADGPPARTGKIAFLFSGQGAELPGMAQELCVTEPVVRRVLERCDEVLRPLLGTPLADLLGPGPTDVAQPALFAVQCALVELWRCRGIEPAAVLGYSLGEYAAAYAAGVLSLEDGLRLVARRGRLMEDLCPPGGMAVLGIAEELLAERLAGRPELAVAGVLGPRSTVVAGPVEALRALCAELATEPEWLAVTRAFHSAAMDPVLPPLREALAGVELRAPRIPWICGLTGREAGPESATPERWVRQARETVRFDQGVETLRRLGCDAFVEIGPQPVCLGAARRLLPREALCLPSLRRGRSEARTMMEALGRLFVAGHPLDQAGQDQGRPRRRVALPTYPFQRQRCWIEGVSGPASREIRVPREILAGHRVEGRPVVPAALFVSELLEPGTVLKEVVFPRALICEEESTVHLHIEEQSFRYAGPGGTVHAAGTLSRETCPSPAPLPLEAIRARCSRTMPGEEVHDLAAPRGIELGPAFRRLDTIWLGDGEALARLQGESALPGLLDSCFQLLRLAEVDGSAPLVPFRVRSLRVHRLPAGSDLWCHARLRPLRPDTEAPSGDLTLTDAAGAPLVEIEGFELRAGFPPPDLTPDPSPIAPPPTGRGAPPPKDPHPRPLSQGRGEKSEEEPVSPLSRWKGGRWERGAGGVRSGGGPASAPGTSTPMGPGNEISYEIRWCEAPPAPGTSSAEGMWIVCADAGGVGEALAARLRERGATVVTVFAHPAFAETPEGFVRLLGRVEGPLRGVIYLWALDAPRVHCLDPGALAAAESLTCAGALHLLQALDARPGPLWLVTRGAMPASEPRPLEVAQAPLWGLGAVAALEQPGRRCRRIDLDPALADPVASLLAELDDAGEEDQVSLAPASRRVPRLVPLEEVPGTEPRLDPRFDPKASYLITGGLGALGLRVAEWMVEHGARNLILVGRRPGQAAARLGRHGARVEVVAADVAVLDEAARAVEAAHRLAPLRGVVHAAGVLDDGVLPRLDWTRFQAVLAPKVAGAWNLHVLTREMRLDLFVLFSSATAALGAAGQGSYAAANAFLDALAHHRRALGLPALSVAWGPWADGGMARQDEESRQRRLARGIDDLPPREGIELLARRIAAGGPAHTVALRADWRLYLDTLPAGAPRTLLAELAAPATASPVAEPWNAARLAGHVRAAAAAVLRQPADRVPLRQSLFDLGMDSLMALELRNELETALGRGLPASFVFDHPTVESIRDALLADGRAEPAASEDSEAARIRDLSDAEAEDLLLAELRRMSFLDVRSLER